MTPTGAFFMLDLCYCQCLFRGISGAWIVLLLMLSTEAFSVPYLCHCKCSLKGHFQCFFYVFVIVHVNVNWGSIFILLSMPHIVALSFFIVTLNTSHKGNSSVSYLLLSISYSMPIFVNQGSFMAQVACPTTKHLSFTLVKIWILH
jgi:hypothetical protein